jgi:hypothetical protein
VAVLLPLLQPWALLQLELLLLVKEPACKHLLLQVVILTCSVGTLLAYGGHR